MEFNVKGITFKFDELEKISLTEIKKETISHAHLFHLLPGMTKAILLLRAGDFVEPSFVTKYVEKGLGDVYALNIINKNELLEFKELWSLLKNASNQKDSFIARDKILNKISMDFWENKEKSFLSFVIASFEEFYFYPPIILEKYQEQSMLLYTRTLLTSSISSIAALCNGFVDYFYIKDLYNSSFMLDYGLIEYGSLNYAMSQACEKERNKPGEGIESLLKLKRPESEITTFKHHGDISAKVAEEYSSLFKYPEVIKFIKFHHEKCDGTGFSNGYFYSGMSDAEVLLMFCDYMIPFSEHIFQKGDGHIVLKSYYNELCKMENQYLIPVNKTMTNWESMMNWFLTKYEEVS